MNKTEREFLNDVKEALDEWDFSYEYYHEGGGFCIDITIDDMDDWGLCEEEIWDAIREVCDDWGAEIDPNMNTYSICL